MIWRMLQLVALCQCSDCKQPFKDSHIIHLRDGAALQTSNRILCFLDGTRSTS